MAEDAVQEVFIRLARDPAKPAAAVNLAAYVMRMAQHAAIDLLRTRQRHARQLVLDPEQPAPPERGDRERDEQMASALAELPIEQRTVVQLRIWEGLSMQDIATFLNLSPNTVSSRWRYALEKLSVLLKGLHDPL